MDNITNDTVAKELAAGTVVFIPFILATFLLALVSNTILVALIIKASKVNNNTNIYLSSIGVIGLIGCFNAFTLLVTLLAQKWVLGNTICFINDFLFRISIPTIPCFHAIISRDRYNAVLHPLAYWRKKNRVAVLVSVFVWVISFAVALAGTIWNASLNSPKRNILGPECYYGLDALHDTQRMDYIPSVVLDVVYFIGLGTCTMTALVHYMIILKELNVVESLRTQYRMLSDSLILKVNEQDKPIRCSSEERTAKSLAILFGFQFVCLAICVVIAFVHIVREFIEGNLLEKSSLTQIEDICLIVVYLLPSINPFLLILCNKRYRNRVKGLLYCKLLPEVNERAVYQTGTDKDSPILKADKKATRPLRKSLFISKPSRNAANVSPVYFQKEFTDDSLFSEANESPRVGTICKQHLDERNEEHCLNPIQHQSCIFMSVQREDLPPLPGLVIDHDELTRGGTATPSIVVLNSDSSLED